MLIHSSDASWIQKTRKNSITIMNPVQWELLVEKCQFYDTNRNDTDDQMNLTSLENYNGTLGMNGTGNGNSSDATPIVFPGNFTT